MMDEKQKEEVIKDFLESKADAALEIEVLGSKDAVCDHCNKLRECYNLKKTNIQDKTIEYGFYCKECCKFCYGIVIDKFSEDPKQCKDKRRLR